jgi:hypothetical protein
MKMMGGTMGWVDVESLEVEIKEVGVKARGEEDG